MPKVKDILKGKEKRVKYSIPVLISFESSHIKLNMSSSHCTTLKMREEEKNMCNEQVDMHEDVRRNESDHSKCKI